VRQIRDASMLRTDPALVVSELTKIYRGKTPTTAVDHLSFSLGRGEVEKRPASPQRARKIEDRIRIHALTKPVVQFRRWTSAITARTMTLPVINRLVGSVAPTWAKPV
jgi:hypothetical protein